MSRLNEIEMDIAHHWKCAEDAVGSCVRSRDAAIEHAWRVGRLLLEGKTLVGHGGYLLWLEKIHVPQQTAWRYTKLASNHSTLSDLKSNMRDGTYAIGIVPEKHKIEHEGDCPLGGGSSHAFTWFNKFMGWKSQVDIGKIKFELTEEVKEGLLPLYEWMKKEVYHD